MLFLRIFKHVLPNAKAWRITVDKQLRQFFEGLSGGGDDAKSFFDNVWLDIFPSTTREIPEWESEFGLPNTLTDEQERRDRLDATWKATGGQSPRYIQDTLQGAGFDVYVHEWWEPGTEPTIGDNNPPATVRNPFVYLNDNTSPLQYLSADGAPDMQDGDTVAQDGGTIQPTGYPLVNKVYVPVISVAIDGSTDMQDGGLKAQDVDFVSYYELRQYVIPVDPTKYPYFLYIGGATFPDHAVVASSRRNEFETLCLKICPNQQWLGILVDYS